jgi:hypothetical protein
MPKMKLESMTQEKWVADCVRHSFVMAERRGRRLSASAKKARAANLKHLAVLTVCVVSTTASPWSGSASGLLYSLWMDSMSMPGFFNNHGSVTPRFSSQYANVASHDGFNLNAMFFSLTYNKRCHQGHGDDVSFTRRRGPLEFEGSTGNPFNGIPTRGDEEAADEDERRTRALKRMRTGARAIKRTRASVGKGKWRWKTRKEVSR